MAFDFDFRPSLSFLFLSLSSLRLLFSSFLAFLSSLDSPSRFLFFPSVIFLVFFCWRRYAAIGSSASTSSASESEDDSSDDPTLLAFACK
jgi:hypothetical protein